MAMIELSLCLDVHHACSSPQARVWLDLEPDKGLSSEVELPLWSVGKNQWCGRFAVDEACCQDFAYRVGVFAHAEAEWSLTFRSCNADAELLADCDRLTNPKAWLIGSCSVQARAQPSAPCVTPSRKQRTPRPKLTLLHGGADADHTAPTQRWLVRTSC
jgi:hypothetical protein